MSLESNGVDRVHSLRKIPTRLRGMNFCTSLAHFALGFVTHPNCLKCTQIVQTHRIMRLGSNGVDRVRSLRNPTWLHGTNFCTSLSHFAPSFVTQLNCPKCTQIVRNTPKYEVRVQWGGSGTFVVKNSDATSWHELFTSLAYFELSFVMQPNCNKYNQIVWNTPKHEVGVQ